MEAALVEEAALVDTEPVQELVVAEQQLKIL
jgi:hypothetical protein